MICTFVRTICRLDLSRMLLSQTLYGIAASRIDLTNSMLVLYFILSSDMKLSSSIYEKLHIQKVMSISDNMSLFINRNYFSAHSVPVG